jgi:hypothetical protein
MVDLRKEREPNSGVERVRVPDEQITVEAPKSGEQNLETLSFMEKIEKRFARVPSKTNDVADDTTTQQQPDPQQPPITLPVNQKQMQSGKNAKVDTGIAWLVTWAIRQIKIITKIGGKVKLQDMPEAE